MLIVIFYSVGFKFNRHENKDCLFGRNIHFMHSNQHTNYEDCSKWCSDNSECGGFTVYSKICYFKTADCKKDLFTNNGRTTFILEGEV